MKFENMCNLLGVLIGRKPKLVNKIRGRRVAHNLAIEQVPVFQPQGGKATTGQWDSFTAGLKEARTQEMGEWGRVAI